MPSNAAEQRCTELGSSCSCSEPLNTTSYTADPNGDGRWINPSDSPPATQCEGELGSAGSWYRNTHAKPEPAQQMPAGSSVATVWRNSASGGISRIIGSKPKSSRPRLELLN